MDAATTNERHFASNEDIRSLLEHLIETTEDGARGFDDSAEHVDDPTVAALFRKLGAARAGMAVELRELAAVYGGPVKESGTVKGALHRGWIKLKDALTGDSVHAVVSAAEEGEDYAVEQYEEALEQALPPNVEAVVRRQYTEVKRAHDEVRALEVATD